MTNERLAALSRKAIEKYNELPPEVRFDRMIASGTINSRGEVLMDPPMYRISDAATSVGHALLDKPHANGEHLDEAFKRLDRAAAVADLRTAMNALFAELGIKGNTFEERIKTLGSKGGPTWRRNAIAKFIKGQLLAEKGDEASDEEALYWLGQAAWDYQNDLPSEMLLEQINNVWPNPPKSVTILE